jgi:hypothetical protein
LGRQCQRARNRIDHNPPGPGGDKPVLKPWRQAEYFRRRVSRGYTPQTTHKLPPKERSEFRGLTCVGDLSGFPSGGPRNTRMRGGRQVRGNSFLILFNKSARAARPRPENHAGIRPDWTCLVKGAKRRCAVRTLDETSPAWRPAWQGFQGSHCPARACEEIQLILLMLGLPEWVPVTVYFLSPFISVTVYFLTVYFRPLGPTG